MKNEIIVLKHDLDTCFADGLFRPLRNTGARAKLDVTYRDRRGRTMRWYGPDALGADDLRILQALVALAEAGPERLSPYPAEPDAKRLRDDLKPEGDARGKNSVRLITSKTRLLATAGYATGGSIHARIFSQGGVLERLHGVSIIMRQTDERGVERIAGSHLLSVAAHGDQIAIALSWRMSALALGTEPRYATLSLVETRHLKSDTARILHQYLSAYVRLGGSQSPALDTLVERVYGRDAAPDAKADARRRQHRTRIRVALAEIGALPAWTVEINGERVVISRKRAIPQDAAGQTASQP